ncbi:MAG TPA: glycosyltransferase [Candidatus Saccharimonadales bacterium]
MLWARRVVRFGVVGLICTLVQELARVALERIDLQGLLANDVGLFIGAQLSFLLSSRWTWQDRSGSSDASAPRWTTFNVVAALALGATSATYAIATYVGARSLQASLIGVLVSTTFTYVVNNTVTFRPRQVDAAKPVFYSDIDLSIIVPAYKEAKRIGATLHALAMHLADHDYGRVEVIVVAADSSDNTAEIANDKAYLFKRFTLVQPGPKVGKGRDVAVGMLHAVGRYRVFMDADLATPLRHLVSVKEFMENSGEVGVGVRNVGHYHNTLTRNLLSRITSLVAQLLITHQVPDTQCGFKVFEATVAVKLFGSLRTLGWNFDMEILALARKHGHQITCFKIPDWFDPKSTEEGLAGESRLRAVVHGAFEPFKIRAQILIGGYASPNPAYSVLSLSPEGK